MQPFLTVTKAINTVQTVNKNMTGDIVVYLRCGTYAIDSTIAIGTSCSGTNGYTVKFMNYTGETPVISGGQAITGWTLYDAAKNIYQATGITFNFRQLYVNGVKAVRARTPNQQNGNAANFWRLTGYDGTAENIQVESSQGFELEQFYARRNGIDPLLGRQYSATRLIFGNPVPPRILKFRIRNKLSYSSVPTRVSAFVRNGLITLKTRMSFWIRPANGI